MEKVIAEVERLHKELLREAEAAECVHFHSQPLGGYFNGYKDALDSFKDELLDILGTKGADAEKYSLNLNGQLSPQLTMKLELLKAVAPIFVQEGNDLMGRLVANGNDPKSCTIEDKPIMDALSANAMDWVDALYNTFIERE